MKNELTIKLSTVEEVKDFVNILTRLDAVVDVGHGRYIVDAKSIMGIFSLDLSKNLNLWIRSGDTDEIKAALKNYIV